MRRLSFLWAIAVVLVTVTGCLKVPQPMGYYFSEQEKMQAAHHWEILAEDVANQINNELIDRGYLVTPVYVRTDCDRPAGCSEGDPPPFYEGFNDLLVTQLVHYGVPTRVEPEENALVVDYKVQVVYHASPVYQWPYPGAITALTAGVVVFRHAPPDLLALALAGAMDMARTTTVVNGHYEVIITTSIVDENKYVMRSSNIYYINDADFWHYQQSNPAAEIQLTNS